MSRRMWRWCGTVRIELEEVFEATDLVVLIASAVASGAASGAPATVRFGQVFTFHEGKMIVVDGYWEAREAVEAVGLRE